MNEFRPERYAQKTGHKGFMRTGTFKCKSRLFTLVKNDYIWSLRLAGMKVVQGAQVWGGQITVALFLTLNEGFLNNQTFNFFLLPREPLYELFK